MAVTEAPAAHLPSQLPAATLVPLQAPLKLNLIQAMILFSSKPPLPLDLHSPPPHSSTLATLLSRHIPTSGHLHLLIHLFGVLSLESRHAKSFTSLTALLKSHHLIEASLTFSCNQSPLPLQYP